MGQYDLKEMLLLERAYHSLDESFKNQNELHIFDFDETLAYSPNSEVKIYFGYYLGKGRFESLHSQKFMKALNLSTKQGIKPNAIKKDKIGPHIILDFHGYELFRQRITKSWRKEVLEPSFEIMQNDWGYDRYVSTKYEFEKPENANISLYQPLPALEILKEKIDTGADCYIVTARGTKNDQSMISKFLKMHKIKIPEENIIPWGSSEKGEAVYQLIERHSPLKAFFYDDGPRNIAHVKATCCGKFANTELHLTKYQRGVGANIGEVEYSESCKGDGTLIESTKIGMSAKQKRNLNNSRQTCRRMRKLSGLF